MQSTQSLPKETHVFKIKWGLHGIFQLLGNYNDRFQNVLDIGSGEGEHKRLFELFGKKVYTVDLHASADYQGDVTQIDFGRTFDVVWCSHALEHQRNVGAFLEKLYALTTDNGFVAISVPRHPRQIFISGHLTNWNAGLLIYNLILAGFDCSAAAFYVDYDLSLIVQKKPAVGKDVHAPAAYEPIENYAHYFPFPVTNQGNAEMQSCNWQTHFSLPSVGRPIELIIENDLGRLPIPVG